MNDKNSINITIDASNLLDGGGLTHLREFLNTFIFNNKDELKIAVVGNIKALNTFPEHFNLKKIHHPFLERNIAYKAYFRLFLLTKICKQINTDIIFDPGGGFYSKKIPYVTMSRNMLVFEKKEASRYGISWQFLRLVILNWLQTRSFNNSAGVIFISEYACNYIEKLRTINIRKKIIIHHGVSDNFIELVKSQREISSYNKDNPFKILYVSRIDVYKHQLKLVEAIHLLFQKGYCIELILVGSSYSPYLNELNKTLCTIPDSNLFVKYLGHISYSQIAQIYKEVDMFAFPSSCENMPNILIEAMSAGLPIACSTYGPMQEFLKDGGEYFNPMNIQSISETIENLILNPELRYQNALKAHDYAQQFSWKKCTDETLNFITDCYFTNIFREL